MQEAVRNNITVTFLTNLTCNFINVTQGDVEKVNLSYSQSYRYRLESVSHISQQIKVQWQPSSLLAIHWDGKLMKSLETKNKEERIPILVSGVNGVKLLGVPNVVHGGAN